MQQAEKNLTNLPDSHQMLGNEADTGDADPAAKSHEDWFSAGFYKLYNIGVQPDGCHSHDDKELAQGFKGIKKADRYAKVYCHSGDHRSAYKKENEKREDFFEIYFFRALFCASGALECQKQCDGDDRPCTGKFYRYSIIKCCISPVIDGVPGRGGSCNG